MWMTCGCQRNWRSKWHLMDEIQVWDLLITTLCISMNHLIFSMFSSYSPKRGHIFGSLLKLFKATCRVKPSCFAAVFLEFSPIFHEKFHAATDYDLLLQCVYKYKVDYVPEVLSKWRDHISSGTSVARVEVPTDNLILWKI